MRYSYNKLKGKIVEVCGSRRNFAKSIGISDVALSAKLNGERYFRLQEIEKAIEVLGIDRSQVPEYFLTPEVDDEH